ncbi:hypothetical protein, partial [Gluconobacter sp. Gdi]|uniref:hypothetical protein n=1 Tax=Gluconobacter sp. Gdi TaxID=2691888 RepID=UPI0019212A55
MATLTQINKLINDISVRDSTAEGTESAGRNLDMLQDKTESVSESLSGMGTTAQQAVKAISQTADDAAQSMEGTASRGIASLSSLRRELTSLRQQEKALQEELDRSASSGADTSETTQRLAAVQKEISQT